MRKRPILLLLCLLLLSAGVFALTWYIACKQMGYPHFIGMLAGYVTDISMITFMIGLLYPTRLLAGLFGSSFIIVAQPWNVNARLSVDQKCAWTAALIMIPAVSFVFGRIIAKRFQVKQITLDQ